MNTPTGAGYSGGRPKTLGYSGFMFDVLVYLYETYWRPDACPTTPS